MSRQPSADHSSQWERPASRSLTAALKAWLDRTGFYRIRIRTGVGRGRGSAFRPIEAGSLDRSLGLRSARPPPRTVDAAADSQSVVPGQASRDCAAVACLAPL